MTPDDDVSTSPAPGEPAAPSHRGPDTPGDETAGHPLGAAPGRPRTETSPTIRRRRILAWAMWDWGSAAFNAVVTTFVFTVWLTSDAFIEPSTVAAATAEGDTGGPATRLYESVVATHSTWLGWGLTAAGLLIALLAPVAGARADDNGRRRRWLGIHTGITVLITAAMFLVVPQEDRLTESLLLGIFLLSVGNIFFELASVNYNATLAQVATPATVGRVSGLGWGAGYVGGIVLLLILFVGFINPDVGWFGVTGESGLNIRVAMLVSALWFGVFALPVLIAVPEVPASRSRARLSLPASYRQLFADVARLWRERRQTLQFLVASAVFRDGLAGVFTFGAVIAAGTFGFTTSGVIVFAIVANLVAGLASFAGGWLDDRVGPKVIIVTSLGGLVVAGSAIFALSGGGQRIFWVFGLLLCLFVGPAQSASRTLLTRLAPAGRESEIFGMYATTGRAASFMAPLAFSVMIQLGGSQRWGIIGIVLVIALGLGLLLPIRAGQRPGTTASAAR